MDEEYVTHACTDGLTEEYERRVRTAGGEVEETWISGDVAFHSIKHLPWLSDEKEYRTYCMSARRSAYALLSILSTASRLGEKVPSTTAAYSFFGLTNAQYVRLTTLITAPTTHALGLTTKGLVEVVLVGMAPG